MTLYVLIYLIRCFLLDSSFWSVMFDILYEPWYIFSNFIQPRTLLFITWLRVFLAWRRLLWNVRILWVISFLFLSLSISPIKYCINIELLPVYLTTTSISCSVLIFYHSELFHHSIIPSSSCFLKLRFLSNCNFPFQTFLLKVYLVYKLAFWRLVLLHYVLFSLMSVMGLSKCHHLNNLILTWIVHLLNNHLQSYHLSFYQLRFLPLHKFFCLDF